MKTRFELLGQRPGIYLKVTPEEWDGYGELVRDILHTNQGIIFVVKEEVYEQKKIHT